MRVDTAGRNNIAVYQQIQNQKPEAADEITDKTDKTDKIADKIDETKKTEITRKTAEEMRSDRETKRIEKHIDKMNEMRGNYEMLIRQMEAINAQGESMAEASRIRVKAMKIAMRIMGGDHVPTKDHLFLLEHDPGLYGKAIMMRREKENPERHKRISEDEDFPDPLETMTGSAGRGDAQPPAVTSADITAAISADPAE
jgi:hypothetical protein